MATTPRMLNGPGTTPNGRWNPAGARAEGTGLAAVAYLLLSITGAIVLLLADRQDKYTRFHAWQSIGLGAVVAGVAILLVVLPAAMGATSVFVPALLQSLFVVAVIASIVVLTLHAQEGRLTPLPLIGDYARRIA